MNIIHTLSCGCHRGYRECVEAQSLRAAMGVAYQDVAVHPEDEGAWELYALLWKLYFEHFEEQATQKREAVQV